MANRTSENTIEEAERRYKAPALEKGLDILELLAKTGEPLTTSQIANKLDRSVSELFRMVLTLEARGYITQVSGKEGYGLSNKMFSLGVAQTSTRTLIEAALPLMKELANEMGQSCHLVVPSNDQIVVIARIESPRDMGFSVRIGYRRPLLDSTSGIILCGMRPDNERGDYIRKFSENADDHVMSLFIQKMDEAREKGYVECRSDFVAGVTDLSCAIMSGEFAIATLVIPYVSCNPVICSQHEALQKLISVTAKITETLAAEAQ